jgi:(p)ppGpp synthase/HD superfamily hydrolase
LVREFHAESFEHILADIGLGERLAPLIAKRLLPEKPDQDSVPGGTTNDSKPLLIKGTEGAVVTLGRCCRPLPGEPIMGYLSAGRGIVIHRSSCNHMADYRKNPDKWVEVQWEQNIDAEFPVDLHLDVINKRGVLATVAAAIAEADTNIEKVNTSNLDGVMTTINLTVNVRGRIHLARIMRRLRVLPEVLRLYRQG